MSKKMSLWIGCAMAILGGVVPFWALALFVFDVITDKQAAQIAMLGFTIAMTLLVILLFFALKKEMS